MKPTKDPITKRRNCTLCMESFTYTQRPGRPPSFCPTHMDDEIRATSQRFCIIDQQPFDKSDMYSPFYCSEECQNTRGLCAKCGNPTKFRYCSHECVQEVFPPPYTCQRSGCSNVFTASEYFMNKVASYSGPPKYCSSACFEQRNTTADGTTAPVAGKRMVDYQIQMRNFTPGGPYSMPIRKNGMPWVGITPTIPQSKLHIRSQNTIKFWDYALNEFTETLTPLEYNAFLFEFVCKRSSYHPKAIELQECWTIWQYIEPYLDDRYSSTMFERFAQGYVHARRAYLRAEGCMALKDLDARIMQCHDAYRTETGPSLQRDDSARHKKFIEYWMRPIPPIEAPYDRKEKGKEHYKSYYSRIQIEMIRFEKAIGALSSSAITMSYLAPLTKAKWDKLFTINMDIMMKYTEAMFTDTTMTEPRTGKYPWGANCYAALIAADKPDALQLLKNEMRTTPNYNLPEPY